MAFIRKYKTPSGATGVQVCYKESGRVVRTVHVGSASTEKGLRKLEREAREIMEGGQPTLFDLSKYDAK